MSAVSVIMPVRNGERYLREAVDSVLGQTLGDLELIVVDDGSIDRTAEILASYLDPRLRVLRHASRGVAASLNAGIRLARSDFVARMDADDVSEPPRLERQVSFLSEHAEYVIVGSDVSVIAESGEFLYRAQLVMDDQAIRHCLDRLVAPFFHGAVVFRRDAVVECGLYDERVRYLEDMLLWLRLQNLGAMANIPEPLYRYRIRPGSVSRRQRGKAAVHVRVLREYALTLNVNPHDARELARPPERTSSRRSRAAYELDLGKIYLDQAGDPRRARPHLVRAVMLAPGSARAWFNLALSLSPKAVRALRIRRRNRGIHLRAGAYR